MKPNRIPDRQKVTRFNRLDTKHISAIETLYKDYPFLKERLEIHMPYSKAKSTFSSNTVWVWPKFDKRPIGFLIFMDDFVPCIWYPDRQEGMTFRWTLPPGFCYAGPTVCLASIIAGESLLQIEDIIIYQGSDLWSHQVFSERWKQLDIFWNTLPQEQALLAFTARIVTPLSLEQWPLAYDCTLYWTIQPDHARQPRWYWKDTVTPVKKIEYIAPKLQRDTQLLTTLCANCRPYTKVVLPDTYSIHDSSDNMIGVAAITTLSLSLELRKLYVNGSESVPVEVKWNDDFNKYQIIRILPNDAIITAASFFNHSMSD
jgi:hypothetical protein